MSEAQAFDASRIKIATTQWTAPYWEAAKQKQLVACRCADCKTYRHFPTPFCPKCRSQKIDWTKLKGDGVLFSYTLCPQINDPETIVIGAIVELPEADGIRLISNVVGIDPANVKIGMPLTVTWNPLADGYFTPVFKPK